MKALILAFMSLMMIAQVSEAKSAWTVNIAVSVPFAGMDEDFFDKYVAPTMGATPTAAAYFWQRAQIMSIEVLARNNAVLVLTLDNSSFAKENTLLVSFNGNKEAAAEFKSKIENTEKCLIVTGKRESIRATPELEIHGATNVSASDLKVRSCEM